MRVLKAVVLSSMLGVSSFLLCAQETTTATPPASQTSLGDYARTVRSKQKPEVKINEEDTQKLFSALSEILDFASKDSQLPKRNPVKHQMIGREEVDKHFAEVLSGSQETQRIQRSELVLKKFGMLPGEFQLNKFLKEAGGSGLAGYYEFQSKTIFLLNWIDPEAQRPVMAHELTHALQDQNFNLARWALVTGPNGRRPTMGSGERDAQESAARRAVVEGQAMIVYLDYMIKPFGSLGDSDDKIDMLKNRLMDVYDSPVKLHNAPMLLQQSTIFPYFDGFAFELELLKKGGREMAFAGAFARPPRDTYEIMNPEAYLSHKRAVALMIPDMSKVLGDGYKAYDSGSIGALDVRVMSQQFGRENDGYAITPNWDGGAYIAVTKPAAAGKADADLVPSDVALMYVSRWKTAESAKRFAELYKSALIKRSKVQTEDAAKPVACSGQPQACTPKWSAQFNSDEGPMVMEIWPNNILLIMQGVDDASISQVRQAILHPAGKTVNASNKPELSMGLMGTQTFQAMQSRVMEKLRSGVGEQ
jgi:hypothetical protein